ncbi:metallophosphoesterase [Larkinella harenae]
MKIITISDLHGRTNWRQINIDQHDKVIFLGDYTDSYNLDDAVILENLQHIIALKEAHPEKVILLIGNHDAQYLHFPLYRCSGFRAAMQSALTVLFTTHNDLFQIAHQEGPYLFTHAGLSGGWLARLNIPGFNLKLELNLLAWGQWSKLNQLDQLLNTMHQDRIKQTALFDVSYLRGGFQNSGGPLWADKQETSTDYIMGLHQVVGHTPVPDFLTIGNRLGSITYTDVLQTKEDFYTLVID